MAGTEGAAVDKIISFLALAATVVIAYLTFRSTQAAERSAQTMERTFKSANDSVLRLEFIILTKSPYPDAAQRLEPFTIESTEEFTQLQSAWRNLPTEQAGTRKHAVYATVKNLGPAVARKVSFVANMKIAQPNVGTFRKEVKLAEIPILEVSHRRCLLAHVFDEVSDQCRVAIEHARVTYTTLTGESRTDEWHNFDMNKLANSPIRGFEP